ncbi:hypothetical protein Dimus_021003 [Dionaea muscipula]
MASMPKFSYQRLRHELAFYDEDDTDDHLVHEVHHGRQASRIRRSGSWSRLNLKRVRVRRRLKIRVPGLKRFFKRKARLMRAAWCKMVKRLKESQAHFGDLFAGNYLFMQVTPASLGGDAKKLGAGAGVGYLHHDHHNFAAGFSGLKYYNDCIR